MRVIFIGCVEFSYHALQHLISLDDVELVGVVTRKSSKFNADFKSLEPLANKAGVPCYLAVGNDQAEMAAWLNDQKPDVIYCFGWSYLLGREVLTISPLGVIGYHPAALPKNRGRHPVIWALALGLSETASTFFFMDEGADSGEILSQVPVAISDHDDASTLYEKLIDVSRDQISNFTRELSSGNYKKIKQDSTCVNHWRKRSVADGLIDWRMSSRSIYNLVRALTRPYPGAHCMYLKQERKIWKCDKIGFDKVEQNLEPGKVLAINDNKITVKCGEGAVVLLEHELNPLPETGDYL